MRAGQIWQWIYAKGCREFSQMTNLSKDYRAKLAETFVLEVPEVITRQVSSDGTRKYLVRIAGGHEVEIVYIPEEGRGTLCISSQVGCTLTCSFCHTGTQKLVRNLSAGEIIGQVLVARDDLGEWPAAERTRNSETRLLSNIVLMGMGEPLLNYKNVLLAIDKITDPDGLAMSPRRITLSTSGIPKMIKKMADDKVKFDLAVSLHSARQEVREKIMPFANKFPLNDLSKSLAYWYQYTKKQITFEYVIWEGINDKKEDIQALIKFCHQIPSKVNLIQYNPIDNSLMKEASEEIIESYLKALTQSKIKVTYRRSRGEDIAAACGQLANKL